MGKKKPNIIECDGLVVRGRNGEKRAEISVDGQHGFVVFDLYGEDDRQVPEPAFAVHVGSEGRSALSIMYTPSEEEEEAEGYLGGLHLSSGDRRTSPSFTCRGVKVELPTRSVDEIAEDASRSVAEHLKEYATEHGLDFEDCVYVLDRADTLLREDEKQT